MEEDGRLVSHLDAHAGNVVQRVHQTLEITAIADLGAHHIGLEKRFVRIVVIWIAIDEAIEEDGIKWKPPVLRRGCICVIRPFFYPVVAGVCCFLVCIKIIIYFRKSVFEAVNEGSSREKSNGRKPNKGKHGDHDGSLMSVRAMATTEKKERQCAAISTFNKLCSNKNERRRQPSASDEGEDVEKGRQIWESLGSQDIPPHATLPSDPPIAEVLCIPPRHACRYPGKDYAVVLDGAC